jgi:hypothetical protein
MPAYSSLVLVALLSGTVIEPIGPDQYFSGLVNGSTDEATIEVLCLGPVLPGATGHPLSGQSVSVNHVAPGKGADIGYTGTASAVRVGFPVAATSGLPVVLRAYATPSGHPAVPQPALLRYRRRGVRAR